MMTLENTLAILNPYAEVRVFNFDESECYADTLVKDLFGGKGVIWSKGFYNFTVVELTCLRADIINNEYIYCIYLDVDTLPHYAEY